MASTNNHRQPFSADERQRLIAAMNDARQNIDQLSTRLNSEGASSANETDKQLNQASEDYKKLLDRYEAGLPRLSLSRCPFSGEEIELAIDNLGLDGPWWDFEAAVRPTHSFPSTVFGFSGAMAIHSKPPTTPFLCKPGPGVPFVIPRLLVNNAVKAVISTIEVGGMTAWPVFFYAEDTPYDLIRINDWGRDYYIAETAHGEGYSLQTYDYYIDYDYDLEFYIRSGRLLWIEPGDSSLKLNSTVSHCPYLGHEGRQYPASIQNGKLWNSLLDEEAVETEHNNA